MTAPAMFASVKAVEAALTADCPTPAAKLVLAILATFVDARLQAFPSMATLQARTGIKSERTLSVHLQALVDAGLLRLERDFAHNGRQTSNVYTLLVPVPDCTPAPPMDKPRRTHRHSLRPVGKSGDNPVRRPSNTPQNLRPLPANIAPSSPAKSAPLEPSKITKDASATPEGQPVASGQAPWKGKRYTAPAAPVTAGRRASEGTAWAGEGRTKLDEALKRLDEATSAAAAVRPRSRV